MCEDFQAGVLVVMSSHVWIIYVVVYTEIEMCLERKAMDKLWLYIK
jgi:hypothetical protein